MSPPRDCVPALRRFGLHEMTAWAEERPVRHGWKGRTCRDLWNYAPNPDWLIRYARTADADHMSMSRAASACVRLAIGHAHPGMRRDAALRMIEATERFADRPGLDTDRDHKEVQGEVAHWHSSLVDAAILARRSPYRSVHAAMTSVFMNAGHAGSEHFMADCSDAIRRMVPFVDLE